MAFSNLLKMLQALNVKKPLLSLALAIRKVIRSGWRFLPTTKYHNDSILSESDVEIYPLRVINVRETLALARGVCFSVPKDWNFHVISHTWSMKVREWSEEVASRIGEETASGRCGYNEAFRNEDFRGRPYYADFLQFLEILQTDGVEKVWFDALCINQRDMQEKSREIMQMGSFYSKSLGCYVLAHGLGQGFGALSEDGSLPRWFSRVWTIQEFLLPKELWFIVELDAETLGKANFRPHEYCRKVALSLESGFLHSSHLYFLNRGSYESVLGWKIIGPQSKQEVMDHLLAFWEFSALKSVIDQPDKAKYTSRITKEVEFRNCSEGHEEDRLLSILALLGVDPRKMNQLRVGRSLEEQILDLLSQLVSVNQHLLLALCASSMHSYPRPGMSWLPHLTRSQGASMSNPPCLAAVPDTTQVTDVSKTGLTLSCRFLRAQCLSFEVHEGRCPDPLHCMSCTFDAKRVVTEDGEAPFRNFRLKWVLNIEVGEPGRPVAFPLLHLSDEGHLMFYINPFDSTHNNPRLISGPNAGAAVENSGLVLNLSGVDFRTDDPYKSLPHFYSWLLLIGHHLSDADEDHTHSISSFVFMVCIGTNPQHLHKVGLLQVKEKNFGPGLEMLYSWYYDQPSQVGAFTVGGFGDQISLYELHSASM